jgi:hypothetical protein
MKPDAALMRIEEASRILATCKSVDEVKDVRDRAAAVTLYYRQRGASLEAQNDAAEIRLRAERRLGELLRNTPKNRGGRPTETGKADIPVSTLGEIGITKIQSSIWQRIARLALADFEERIAEAKENALELTTTRLLHPPRRPGLPEVLHGSCPTPGCENPARGAGGTKCWQCQKRLQRGQDPQAELVGAVNELEEAARAFYLAREDGEYEQARKRHRNAALLYAWACGWRIPGEESEGDGPDRTHLVEK